jgi:quercetin dioxygenase-like cupin family protein
MVSAPNFSQPARVSLIRWDELALEKVTEMIARKVVAGVNSTLAQIYLKKGALIPWHAHESEQLTYVLEGALRVDVAGDATTVREGEVLHVPAWAPHQAEAIDDTFVIGVYSPARTDWLRAPDAPQEAP